MQRLLSTFLVNGKTLAALAFMQMKFVIIKK